MLYSTTREEGREEREREREVGVEIITFFLFVHKNITGTTPFQTWRMSWMTPIEQHMRAQQNSWQNRLVGRKFAVTTIIVITTKFSNTDNVMVIT